MTFGLVSSVGGILLALGGSLPISPYITTISFLIYLTCRLLSLRTSTAGGAARKIRS